MNALVLEDSLDRRPSDAAADLPQFSDDPFVSPEHVLDRHPPHDPSDAFRNAWPARPLERYPLFHLPDPLAIRRGLDNFHHTVYLMIEGSAPTHEFCFLLRRRRDPAGVDARAQDSGLRDEELNASVVTRRKESGAKGPEWE